MVNFSGQTLYFDALSNGSGTLNVASGANVTATNVYFWEDNISSSTVAYNQTGGSVNASSGFALGESGAGGQRRNVQRRIEHLERRHQRHPDGRLVHHREQPHLLFEFQRRHAQGRRARLNWLQSSYFTTAAVNAAGGIIDNGGYAITINQVFSHGTGTPDGGLIFQGSGTTNLAANTYTGGTTVKSGILQLGSTSALGTMNYAVTAVNIAAGATLDVNSYYALQGITIAGTGTTGQGALVNNGATTSYGASRRPIFRSRPTPRSAARGTSTRLPPPARPTPST